MKYPVAPTRARAIILALALILIAVSLPHNSTITATAQSFEPAGELRELAIDDGEGICLLPVPESMLGKPGFGWVNKLTPPSYPATLRSITIGFNRAGPIGREAKANDLYRIVVYLDPEMDGPENDQPPDATFIGRVRGTDQSLMTFNLVTPITITSGSFVVGVLDEFGIADAPLLFDSPGLSNPPGSEAFFTQNGGDTWRSMAEGIIPNPPCGPGSFLIRATVESNPVAVPTITRIKDPQAVEPWGVAANDTEVFVTNLVSNNVTIIRKSDNSFQTVPLGIEGVSFPGPFGVVAVPESNSAFVTIFGSNTIPTKEFAVDYSAIGSGLVVRLVRQANGSYAQAAAINVGKGPMFPAVVRRTGAPRLYVPCAGANRVDVIDTSTNQKVAEIPVGREPSSCTVSLTGNKVYVTNFADSTISVINTQTNQVIKTIAPPELRFPQSIGPQPPILPQSAFAQNPWMGAISQRNGNLYVTYWGSTMGEPTPNGAVVEFDTCADTFLRFILDDTTRGTASGSAGASGIPAPSAPLTRNAATGMTPGAGGGGGGPFGITACSLALSATGVPANGQPPLSEPTILFTNDGSGTIGAIDARIDQVVTAPAFSVAACPKPRGIACSTATINNQVRHLAYVACGQPDSSVLLISIPVLSRENIPGYLPIEFAVKDTAVRVRSATTVFPLATRVQLIEVATGACLSFSRAPKFKKGGRVLVQKGGFTDGRSQSEVSSVIYRIVYPDGSVRLVFPSP